MLKHMRSVAVPAVILTACLSGGGSESQPVVTHVPTTEAPATSASVRSELTPPVMTQPGP